MDEQRKAIYGQRQALLESKDVSATIQKMIEDCLYDEVDLAVPSEDAPEARNYSPRNGRRASAWSSSRGVERERLRETARPLCATRRGGDERRSRRRAGAAKGIAFGDGAALRGAGDGHLLRRRRVFREWTLPAWSPGRATRTYRPQRGRLPAAP